MSAAQARKGTTRRGKWTTGIRATAQFAAVLVIAIALFAFLHQKQQAARWPLVQGTVQETRIVADHALQTKSGGQVTWKAEYKVAYAVASREYTVWADSGIQGESEAAVRLALPRARSACRVKYNPHRPEIAIADCR